jgi:hypothetical protein
MGRDVPKNPRSRGARSSRPVRFLGQCSPLKRRGSDITRRTSGRICSTVSCRAGTLPTRRPNSPPPCAEKEELQQRPCDGVPPGRDGVPAPTPARTNGSRKRGDGDNSYSRSSSRPGTRSTTELRAGEGILPPPATTLGLRMPSVARLVWRISFACTGLRILRGIVNVLQCDRAGKHFVTAFAQPFEPATGLALRNATNLGFYPGSSHPRHRQRDASRQKRNPQSAVAAPTSCGCRAVWQRACCGVCLTFVYNPKPGGLPLLWPRPVASPRSLRRI